VESTAPYSKICSDSALHKLHLTVYVQPHCQKQAFIRDVSLWCVFQSIIFADQSSSSSNIVFDFCSIYLLPSN